MQAPSLPGANSQESPNFLHALDGAGRSSLRSGQPERHSALSAATNQRIVRVCTLHVIPRKSIVGARPAPPYVWRVCRVIAPAVEAGSRSLFDTLDRLGQLS